MEDKKSLTLKGLTLPNFAFLLVSIGMVFVSIYLTQHYFETFYPEGIAKNLSLCNLSDFWGCDKATRSPLGNIFGVPTSLFGLLIGVIGMVVTFAKNEAFEKTAKALFTANAIGCVLLFLYSLLVLKSLCPMCTAYYVLSVLAMVILFKFSNLPLNIDVKASGIFLVLLLLPTVAVKAYINGKQEKIQLLSQSYINEFNKLESYGAPGFESPYKLNMATEKFSDAPIRMTIFSDFQCPFCRSVAEQLHPIIEEFKDQMNVQYMFYPLDDTCNSKMERPMHPFACKAAYLAACDKAKFAKIHDHIFANQDNINMQNITQWEKDFGLANCLNNKVAQDAVQQTLNAGLQYNLRSTPTIIINGKKVEGMIPSVHLKEILRSLIK